MLVKGTPGEIQGNVLRLIDYIAAAYFIIVFPAGRHVINRINILSHADQTWCYVNI